MSHTRCMNSPRLLRALLATALTTAFGLVALAPAAGAKTVWVCHPDKTNDPCDVSLTATQVTGLHWMDAFSMPCARSTRSALGL